MMIVIISRAARQLVLVYDFTLPPYRLVTGAGMSSYCQDFGALGTNTCVVVIWQGEKNSLQYTR